MTNKLKSSLHKSALTTGILAGIILTNKDALAQTIASNGKSTTQTEETRSNITRPKLNIPASSPLGKIREELKTYPKELQDHYELAMSSFYIQEEIDLINKLLEENILNNITDVDEGVRVALQCIETIALQGRIQPTISRRVKINKPINENNRTYIINFRTAYQEQFKTLKQILDAKITETKENIERSKENIERSKENIERSKENIERIDKKIQELKTELEQMQQIIEKNEETIKKNEETIKKNEETIKKNEETIKKNEETIKKNEETIKKNEETIRENKRKIKENIDRFINRISNLENNLKNGTISPESTKPIINQINRFVNRVQKYQKFDIQKEYPNVYQILKNTK